MSVQYELIEIERPIVLKGIGKIPGKASCKVPQVGWSTPETEGGESTFDGLDLEEMLNVIEVNPLKDSKTGEKKTPDEIQAEREMEVVRHFNNGLKAAMRSGAYAAAGALSNVEESKELKSLKKSIDSFVKDFGMSEEQAAAAVKNIPTIATLINKWVEDGTLIPE